MLEQKVHVGADAADISEHVGLLHVVRVRAKAVETGEC
jgi:hypothetical protein